MSDPLPPSPAPDAALGKERRELLTWLWRLPVLVAVGATGWGAWEAYRVHFSKVAPDASPTFIEHPPARVAALADFPELWSSVAFTYAGTPAVALRLPEAVPGGVSENGLHYAAFSRVCTHLGCSVSLNSNLEAVAIAFNYRTPTPVLACPCHLSIFAPLQAGQAVSGPAREPLPRAQLTIREGALFAVGLEVPA